MDFKLRRSERNSVKNKFGQFFGGPLWLQQDDFNMKKHLDQSDHNEKIIIMAIGYFTPFETKKKNFEESSTTRINDDLDLRVKLSELVQHSIYLDHKYCLR